MQNVYMLTFFNFNCYLVVQDTRLVQKVLIMDPLSSTDDVNLRLHNTSLKVLSVSNYTLLPFAVQLLEAPLEIVFQIALQNSCCCYTSSTLLKCHLFI
jgi:hypothetical protein